MSHLQYPIRVDVKRHLDLRSAARSWGNARQLELAQQTVVACHGTLAFEHLRHHKVSNKFEFTRTNNGVTSRDSNERDLFIEI